jgi:Topoisomerase 6 subunit A/Spo11, Toprim domain
MGADDDIKRGLTKNLTNFTKQRKAEEKHTSAGRWRRSRMTEVRGMYLIEAANEVMEECYNKASDNGRLPATARQIFYVARPLMEERTDKPLTYSYFSQTLLPDYINAHGVDWDVVYDDRGHFTEPHTERVIGLGTLNVRWYNNRVRSPRLDEADFSRASIETFGPDGCFGAVLYVEKEGFMPLFERVELAKRYDIAIMSSKGMSVTAARDLVNHLDVPVLVLHDFDASGIIIVDTLANSTRRYAYGCHNVIDIGLQYADISGLAGEPANCNIMAQAGLDQSAIDFLSGSRVELNAMTSRQLIDFVENKLKEHGVEKVIPEKDTLEKTYRMFAASDRLSEAYDEMSEKLEEDEAAKEAIAVPDDLEAKIKDRLQKEPSITWHRAVRLIIDPDAPEDEDDDEDDGGEDDEDLSDIDE